MNAPHAPDRGLIGRKLAAMRADDREFLPAALEILETPPSPRPVALAMTICAFAACAVAWSFFGRLDVHAVAWGKLEPSGRAKVIQPFDSGRVAAIRAENGSKVRAGDVLIQLDPAEAQADALAAADTYASVRAEIARRRVAIGAVEPLRGAGGSPERLAEAAVVDFEQDVPTAIRARETAVLRADLAQLRDTLANLAAQSAQKKATRQRLEMSVAQQEGLLQTLAQRVDMRETALRLSVGTKVNLFDAREALHKAQAQIASDRGQLIETDAAIEEIASTITKTIAQFAADNENRLAEAARKADDAQQQAAKTRARLARMTLVAPLDGVVQQVAVTTIGQVVTTGQQLMIVVPSDGGLQAEVYISNADRGFVKAGQQAEIKLDAFPFTRYGTISGRVTRVATDAVDEQEAKRAQSNAIAPANSAVATPSATPGQPQSFVFAVTIMPERTEMRVGDAVTPLNPGMTVTAEIKTDSRRIVDYLLSPLARVASEAMKER